MTSNWPAYASWPLPCLLLSFPRELRKSIPSAFEFTKVPQTSFIQRNGRMNLIIESIKFDHLDILIYVFDVCSATDGAKSHLVFKNAAHCVCKKQLQCIKYTYRNFPEPFTYWIVRKEKGVFHIIYENIVCFEISSLPHQLNHKCYLIRIIINYQ